MKRYCCLLVAAFFSSLLTGCVERRFVVMSEPAGALVLRNGKPIGSAPADDHFTYYGDYQFTLIKDGYQTLQVNQAVPAPWYERFPFEFFSENLWPGRIKDVRRFKYQLEPIQTPRTDELLQRGQELRNRGWSINSPPEGQ